LGDNNTSLLRSFYSLGQQVLVNDALCDRQGKSIRSWGSLAKLRKRSGRRQNELSAARRLASLYPEQKFAWFCALGQSKGSPLTKSHAMVLIQVSDGRRRNRLARTCAEQAWSVRKLIQEVKKICPHRAYGGRQFSHPQSAEDAFRTAERLAKQWIRWLKVLEKPVGGRGRDGVTLGEMPVAIQRSFIAVKLNLEKACKQVQVQLHRRSKTSGKPNRRKQRRRS
jgi:hypothetical protein